MPGRGPQPAVADVADAEAVLGDRRQQGDGAAEQHGEHVEGDGAEQHRPVTDEAQPLQGVVQRRPLVAPACAPAAGAGSGCVRDQRAAVAKQTAATRYGTAGSTS